MQKGLPEAVIQYFFRQSRHRLQRHGACYPVVQKPLLHACLKHDFFQDIMADRVCIYLPQAAFHRQFFIHALLSFPGTDIAPFPQFLQDPGI